ncbi:glycosyltransferase family 25 protein [Oceanospirillaceae bacterium]|nr:glycosyltransferase family 25 protein [Oceanospirillaceae bacterium]
MSQYTTLEKDQSSINENFELYVINLDRSKDRWAKINGHLTGYGLLAQRISAVDAKALPFEALQKHYNSEMNRTDFFIGLKPAEIGCFLSHRKALKAFLNDSKKPFAIILEDDVEFVVHPQAFCEQWLEVLNVDSPVMLKLFKRRPISGKKEWPCVTTPDQNSYLDKVVHAKLIPLGTQGQIVNRAAAANLLVAFEKFSMPVDVAYQHWWHHGVKVLVATPNQLNEISQIVGGSNIAGSLDLTFGSKVKRELGRSWFRLKLKVTSSWYYHSLIVKAGEELSDKHRINKGEHSAVLNTYVINLERSIDRWQYIHKHLSDLGIVHQRVDAIDAQLNTLEKSGYDVVRNKNEYFAPLKNTEIACYLSHIKALKQFLNNSSVEYVLVLEDDVELLETPLGIFALCNWLGCNNAGVVKLYSKRKIFGRTLGHVSNTAIIKPCRIPLGFQAQLWNRLAAEEFINKNGSFYQPVDVELQFAWRNSFSVYVVGKNKVREVSDQLGGSTISLNHNVLNWTKLRLELVRPWFRFKLLVKSIMHFATQRDR